MLKWRTWLKGLATGLVGVLVSVCAWAQPIDANPDEEEAQRALDQMKFVRLRELANKLVEKYPDRPGPYYYLGYSLHHSEGDLPRARFYLEKARDLFVDKHGATPGGGAPWGWLERILEELQQLLAEMDDYEGQIKIIDDYDKLIKSILGRPLPVIQVLYAWPYMKLGNEAEARRRLDSVAAYQDRAVRLQYLNSKGALEMETDHPQACYATFKELVDTVRRRGWPLTCTYLRNAGEAASTVGKFDEAERLYLEATEYFDPMTFSNPWWDLTTLYMSQGRFPEAVSALKSTHEWARNSQAFLAQQSWASDQQLTCELLLQLGMTEPALRIAESFVNRPDRKGGDSVQRDQAEAANFLIYRDALLARRAAELEEMTWAKGKRWWELWWEQRRLAWDAYYSGQRAAAVMIENGRLHSSLRWMFAHGTVMIPNFARPELVKIYGPGVVLRAIDELQATQWDGKEFEQPYLLSLVAEAQAVSGRTQEAIKSIEECLEKLPRSEVVLKARLLGRLAQLQYRAGDAQAYNSFQKVMEQAPSVMRTLELALPVKVVGGGGPVPSQAASLLLRSPRFREDDRGLTVSISSQGEFTQAQLLTAEGSVLSTAQVKNLASTDQTARDLVAEIHANFFAPRIDMTQLDVNSLDGMTTGAVQSKKLQEMFFPGSTRPGAGTR